MAESSKALIELDLKSNPLGQLTGEERLNVPFNSTAPAARIYIINRTGTQQRRVVKVGVSTRRGARQALAADPSLRKDFTPQSLYDEVARGADLNVYEDVIRPVVLKVTFNSRDFLIYPAEVDKNGNVLEEAKPHLVPEGVWDLYLGNYQRMRSTDEKVRGEEAQRVAVAWTQRHNPVLAVTDDGKREVRENPFGFVEFIRVVEREAPQTMDRDFATALDLVEA